MTPHALELVAEYRTLLDRTLAGEAMAHKILDHGRRRTAYLHTLDAEDCHDLNHAFLSVHIAYLREAVRVGRLTSDQATRMFSNIAPLVAETEVFREQVRCSVV